MSDRLRYNDIGLNLGKPAVSVNWTDGYVTVVGECVQMWIEIPRDSLGDVDHLSFWEYHDALVHSNEYDYSDRECEACERMKEMGLK